MSEREAVEILMMSPGYQSSDPETRRKLVEQLCMIRSEWFRSMVEESRGKPGVQATGTA